MAEFTTLTACEADTELREMRQLMLKQVANLERDGKPAAVTQRRIHALNRAMQSLTQERPVQAQLPGTGPTKRPARRTSGRSPYGG